ncbi:AraC family transcriptional regulator [Rubellicoccus peritrichatus]|uniref:AraC family transcriptional regulator n=1 Tax=Rubellicoccus peritrichatus TaxID=3080537 RepID=A0AAQ3QY73_9BACT|nr:AraC family transcriptional regulator [Puniceicoccus sp. CR14]WOO43530.1 AraC family transcriptional regulator [Puniceicoccus sp. CR14]
MNIYESFGDLIASEYTYKAHGTYGPRIHYELRLVYPYTGYADVRIDDVWHHVEQGQMIFLLPGTEEEYLFASECESSIGWCAVLNPQPRDSLVAALAHLPAVHTCSERFKELAHMAEAMYPANLAGELEVYYAIIQTMFCEFFRIADYQEGQKSQMHPAVKRGVWYIEKHFHEALDVPQIARHAGVSPQHLVRIFKRDLNISPAALLWETRCEHAARMLRNTGFSASEIAYRCGFANPNHFSRVFKAHYNGVPPAAYRRSVWSAKP